MTISNIEEIVKIMERFNNWRLIAWLTASSAITGIVWRLPEILTALNQYGS